MCDVIDALQYTHLPTVTPELIQARVSNFITRFLTAFGESWIIPKIHWCLHYALHLHRFGLLLSCFVHERKHRIVKRYANDIMNTRVFERSVLSEMICDHVACLGDRKHFSFAIGLVEPVRKVTNTNKIRAALDADSGAAALNVLTSGACRFSMYSACHKRDVVFVKDGGSFVAGQVWAHFSIGGVLVSVVSLWTTIVSSRPLAIDWQKCDNPTYVDSEEIIDTAVWVQQSDTIVRTLLSPMMLLRM